MQLNFRLIPTRIRDGKEMSHLMGKPTICICENKDADQLRGNREADQRLCFHYSDNTIPLLLNSEISSFYLFSVLVQDGLCRTCSESTWLVCPRGGSNDNTSHHQHCNIPLSCLLFIFIGVQRPCQQFLFNSYLSLASIMLCSVCHFNKTYLLTYLLPAYLTTSHLTSPHFTSHHFSPFLRHCPLVPSLEESILEIHVTRTQLRGGGGGLVTCFSNIDFCKQETSR